MSDLIGGGGESLSSGPEPVEYWLAKDQAAHDRFSEMTEVQYKLGLDSDTNGNLSGQQSYETPSANLIRLGGHLRRLTGR